MPLRVNIDGTDYRLPLTVADISLRTHLKIVRAEQDMPREMAQLVGEASPEKRRLMASRLPKAMYAKKFLPYMARIIGIAGGIPLEVLKGDKKSPGIPIALIDTWYWQTMRAYETFSPTPERTRFQVNGQTWALPEKHMEKSTFGQFAEAAQYEEYTADVAGGNWEKMPYVMAVLLRPEGERFDPETWDDIADERADIMRDLGMDVVYATSFFLLRQKEKLKVDSLIYTTARLLATFKPGFTASPKPLAGI